MKEENTETVLVTGGTGYIGSHTVVKLLNTGRNVVILDNLCNSSENIINRIEMLTSKRPKFIRGDICDKQILSQLFQDFSIDKVIHFAGLKAAQESTLNPLKYYENNVVGSLRLLQAMHSAGVFTIVFASSATVYGNTTTPYHENMPLKPINTYGRTKLLIEDILRDLKNSHPEWHIALLRYFNPIGAHESGLIGEYPATPNNLMPLIAQVALQKRDKLYIFGNDYSTHDGTGLRDYIHIDDLVSGHLVALDALANTTELITVNLGTGTPYSVFDIINTFEKISGKTIPYEIHGRRQGDLAKCYADPSLAQRLLGWKAQHDIERMCIDSWRWYKNNPHGYN